MPAKISFAIMLLPATLALACCQAPGDSLKANVHPSGQFNTMQDAKVIRILAVMPTKIETDNAANKQTAQLVGGLLGALGGKLAGSLVPPAVLIDGVSITYEDNNRTLNSAQAGHLCEFLPGKAIMIATSPIQGRIEPNAKCPQVASK